MVFQIYFLQTKTRIYLIDNYRKQKDSKYSFEEAGTTEYLAGLEVQSVEDYFPSVL